MIERLQQVISSPPQVDLTSCGLPRAAASYVAPDSPKSPVNVKDPPQADIVLEVKEATFDNKLRDEIDFFYKFKDPAMQSEFHQYHSQKQSNVFLLFVVLVIAICVISGSVSAVYVDFTHASLPHFYLRALTSIASAFSGISATLVGVIVFYLRRQALPQAKIIPSDQESNSVSSNQNTSHNPSVSMNSTTMSSVSSNNSYQHVLHTISTPPTKHSLAQRIRSMFSWLHLHPQLVTWLMIYLVVQVQIALSLAFVRRSFNFYCGTDGVPISSEFVGDNVCYTPALKMNVISSNSVYVLLLPILFIIGLPEVPIQVIWMMHIFSISIYVACIIALNAAETIPVALVWIATAYMLIREFQVRNLIIFRTNRKLRQALVENHRITQESHAIEMRYLISNVAHDLKTVSKNFYYLILLKFALIDVFVHIASVIFYNWNRIYSVGLGQFS